jgi:predicted RNase H-like HicB family nuclease
LAIVAPNVQLPVCAVAAIEYDDGMLRYHVAFHLPRGPGEMVVAGALDFPGAVTQGFDLNDARLTVASALEDLAEALLEEGQALLHLTRKLQPMRI